MPDGPREKSAFAACLMLDFLSLAPTLTSRRGAALPTWAYMGLHGPGPAWRVETRKGALDWVRRLGKRYEAVLVASLSDLDKAVPGNRWGKVPMAASSLVCLFASGRTNVNVSLHACHHHHHLMQDQRPTSGCNALGSPRGALLWGPTATATLLLARLLRGVPKRGRKEERNLSRLADPWSHLAIRPTMRSAPYTCAHQARQPSDLPACPLAENENEQLYLIRLLSPPGVGWQRPSSAMATSVLTPAQRALYGQDRRHQLFVTLVSLFTVNNLVVGGRLWANWKAHYRHHRSPRRVFAEDYFIFLSALCINAVIGNLIAGMLFTSARSPRLH